MNDKEEQKEREKKLEVIKAELENLKKNNTGEIAFLTYVYKSFPPTHPTWKKPTDEEMGSWKGINTDSDSRDDLKEAEDLFKKAITYYHPDRISVEEHGESRQAASPQAEK
ncbi:hypothetical protein AC249_AIPGENE12485 [Exaiptasia diaphana]|nr:hypothetical protein AC249_AIPGENE12485 [Exaiptasia diaphana]